MKMLELAGQTVPVADKRDDRSDSEDERGSDDDDDDDTQKRKQVFMQSLYAL